MKQSNHIDIMLIIISKFVFVYDEKTKTKPYYPSPNPKLSHKMSFLVLAYPSSSEDWNDHSSSDCSMSVNAMFHKCLYHLFLNSKRLIELLMSNGKEFQNVWLRKKKDLLRLLMLVVVEAIFDTNERLSRCVLRRRLSPL